MLGLILLVRLSLAATFFNPSQVPLTSPTTLSFLVNAFTGSSPFSFNIWVYPKVLPTTYSDIFWWGTGKYVAYTGTGEVQLGTVSPTLSLTTSIWAFVSVRCGAADSELAVGGSSVTLVGGFEGMSSFVLGGESGERFNGYLRELQVYSQDLPLTTLSYYGYRKGSYTAQLAYSLDEGIGPKLYNNGQAYGATNINPYLWETSTTAEPPLCPALGYYPSAGTCQACHSRCLKCSGPAYTDCQQCRSGCSLMTYSYVATGSNTCHCPHRQNVKTGSGTPLSFPMVSTAMSGITDYTVQVWSRIRNWGTPASALLDTCSVSLQQASLYQVRLYDGSNAHGTSLMDGVSTWVHFAIVVDSSGLTIKLYRNSQNSVNAVLAGAVAEPTCFTLGSSTLQAYFREARMYSGTRTQAEIQTDWRHRVAGSVPVLLYVYFPLDETSGTTLRALGKVATTDLTGTFSFQTSEDPVLILCEGSNSIQTIVYYDNWWYCDQTPLALAVGTTDLSLPLPDVSTLPDATLFFVVDFWIRLSDNGLFGTTLVSFGPFYVDTFALQLRVRTTVPTQTDLGSPLILTGWSYVKLWIRNEDIRMSLDNSTPVMIGGLTGLNLQPTEMRITALATLCVKYLRLFKREITTSLDITPAFSYHHFGDLGWEDLLADWPLNEGIGLTVYDHSFNQLQMTLGAASSWVNTAGDIQPYLDRGMTCSPTRGACIAVSTRVGVVLGAATNYLACNLGGSVPTSTSSCQSRWTVRLWRSRANQFYVLSAPSPVTSTFGYELSFWFSINTFTTGIRNILAVDSYVKFLIDNDNSRFLVQAKSASGTYITLFQQTVTYQRWYPVHFVHHANPPSFHVWVAAITEVTVQQYADIYYPLTSANTIYYGTSPTEAGFDGHLVNVVFYQGADFYRNEILLNYGYSSATLFALSGFKALYSFENSVNNAYISEMLFSTNIDFGNLAEGNSIFEVPSCDAQNQRPDYCPSNTYLFSGCTACDSACNQCYGAGATNCHQCSAGNYLYFPTKTCSASCPAGLTQTAANTCIGTTCFPNCSGCTEKYHYSCNINCPAGLDGNGLGYCNGQYINPASGSVTVTLPVIGALASGFLLDFWVYVQSWSSFPQQVVIAGQYSLVVTSDSNRLKLQVGTDSTLLLKGPSVVLSQWLHIFLSITLAQAQLLVYFKSADSSELSSQGLPSGQYLAPGNVVVGGSSPRLDGFITELRVWNSPFDLSKSSKQGLIRSLTYSYLSSLYVNTVLYYPLVEGSGTVLHSKFYSGFDQVSAVTLAGLVWQSPGSLLHLCPDSGYYYVFQTYGHCVRKH